MKEWITNWLRDIYGLEDGDIITTDDIEDLLELAITDYIKEHSN